jgi:hypothetical protein
MNSSVGFTSNTEKVPRYFVIFIKRHQGGNRQPWPNLLFGVSPLLEGGHFFELFSKTAHGLHNYAHSTINVLSQFAYCKDCGQAH